ncbi:MAG: MmcQ/YjbR family DNA-binding protein [Bacteroidota bacterium]
MTIGQARKIALVLPGAEERDHRGHPSFRVGKSIFATLWPDKKMAVLKLNVADQQDLIAQYPKGFSLNSWSSQGWTNVHLNHVTNALFRILITDAWQSVTVKKKKAGA